MKSKILLLCAWFVRTFLFFHPLLLIRFRGWLYGLGMKHCRKNFRVTHSAILKELLFMSIGDNVYIVNLEVIKVY